MQIDDWLKMWFVKKENMGKNEIVKISISK